MRYALTACAFAITTGFAADVTVEVDPRQPLVGDFRTVLGSWEASGDAERWLGSGISGLTIANGTIQGTASGTVPMLSLSGIASGPDLDLGFNDLLDLRLQVPGASGGPVTIQYGVTASGGTGTTGFAAARTIQIPADRIVRDGQFHTYRLNLGLEPWWRGQLSDLRIIPVQDVGATFAIDSVAVGDADGDVYLPNLRDQEVDSSATDPEQNKYERSSKHFRFIWTQKMADVTIDGRRLDQVWAQGILRNLEECWQGYVRKHGYFEPSRSMLPEYQDGKDYKVNVLSRFNGYWMGGSPTGFGYLNITPDGLRVDPPSWVIPHELFHVFQMHQGGKVPGAWWEFSANFARETYLTDFAVLHGNETSFSNAMVTTHMLGVSHGRNYYECWPFLLYLEENPDQIPGLGAGTFARLVQTCPDEHQAYQYLAAPAAPLTTQDLLGLWSRRMVTFDYQRKEVIRQALAQANPDFWTRLQISPLQQRTDDPQWWMVAPEMAPMQTGFAIHELSPTGSGERIVQVEFQGLADRAKGAGWRINLVAVDAEGTTRYGQMWSDGMGSMRILPHDQHLYLVVAGTPDQLVPQTDFLDSNQSYRRSVEKQRYPYEVRLTGAVPTSRPAIPSASTTRGLVQHAHGGGWKSPTANVAPTVYLAPDARVLDRATVSGQTRIEDQAVVGGDAVVGDEAIVSGHAVVREGARVGGRARIRDWSWISGNSRIDGDARVLGHAQIFTGVITGQGRASGVAQQFAPGTVSGWGMIDGDYAAGRDVASGVAYGHQPWVGCPDSCIYPIPSHAVARYGFAQDDTMLALDEVASSNARKMGRTRWIESDGKRVGFLDLPRTGWLKLNRSLVDVPALTTMGWVRLHDNASSQSFITLGARSSSCLAISLDDSGVPLLTVSTDKAQVQVRGIHALPRAVWTHLAATLSGTQAVLLVDGVVAASADCTIIPDELLGENTASSPCVSAIGRGPAGGPPLYGAIDEVSFFSRALAPAEIHQIYEDQLKDTTGRGFEAWFWTNPDLSGAPSVHRLDQFVDFLWHGASPVAPIPREYFSARWQGTLVVPKTGTYLFRANADDGVRLHVKGDLVIDDWTVHAAIDQVASVNLTEGEVVVVQLDYFQAWGGSKVTLLWTPPGQTEEVMPGSVFTGNQRPALTVGVDQQVEVGSLVRIPVSATDSDAGQQLRFSLGDDAPPGVTIDETNGAVTWTASEAGTYPIVIRVTDDGMPAMTMEQTVTVTITTNAVSTNHPPSLIPVGDRVMTLGQTLVIPISANDPDAGQTLSFSALCRDQWVVAGQVVGRAPG